MSSVTRHEVQNRDHVRFSFLRVFPIKLVARFQMKIIKIIEIIKIKSLKSSSSPSRSGDLRVMSPARFHCAMLLVRKHGFAVIYKVFALILVK